MATEKNDLARRSARNSRPTTSRWQGSSSHLRERAKSCVRQDRYQVIKEHQQISLVRDDSDEPARVQAVIGQESKLIHASLQICRKIAEHLKQGESFAQTILDIGVSAE